MLKKNIRVQNGKQKRREGLFFLLILIELFFFIKVVSKEASPDWSKNIRDVDGIEFIALSRKQQNRLRLVKKKATVGRKVTKGSVLKYDKREERRAREVEKERMVNILMVRTGKS